VLDPQLKEPLQVDQRAPVFLAADELLGVGDEAPMEMKMPTS
jgi:hypothetical protein